jgi:hypothetical protein
MNPTQYKIGTNIIYRMFGQLDFPKIEGKIVNFSDNRHYVKVKQKNGGYFWSHVDELHVYASFSEIPTETKSEVSEYIVDPINDFISKKKKSEEEMQKVIFKTNEADDPRMTDEDWNALANQLYSNKNTYGCYPENYSETDCRYFLEIYNDTDWKLCMRNNMNIPKFGMSGELHPYTLGEGKIDKPEMISMYNLRNLKRIVDGLNSVAKPNEDLNSYPKMSKGDWKKFRENDPR